MDGDDIRMLEKSRQPRFSQERLVHFLRRVGEQFGHGHVPSRAEIEHPQDLLESAPGDDLRLGVAARQSLKLIENRRIWAQPRLLSLGIKLGESVVRLRGLMSCLGHSKFSRMR